MQQLTTQGAIGVALLVGASYVWYLVRRILREEPGTPKMQEIAQAIQSGSQAFLSREYRILAVFTVVMAITLLIFVEPRPVAAIVYVLGTLTSALSGFIGMSAATRANVRTAHAASRDWGAGLSIAFSAGAVMGFSVVTLGLLGLTVVTFLFNDPYVTISFAFGASAVALFLRVGGGIFTKSADVGADLVGKVEQSIPEDDPRNAAVIADNVGDNVGDIAGMGSDLYESYVSSVAAAMVLGGAVLGLEQGMIVPLLLAGAGLIVSVVGSLFVRPGNVGDTFDEQVRGAQKAMNMGVYVSNGLMVLISYVVIHVFTGNILLFWALVAGLVAGFLISLATEYYTSAEHHPAREIARSCQSGPALTIIEGMGTGMMSTVLPVLLVVLATVVSYGLGGLFGISLAAMGMLINLGMLLAMDCYGPIADNAAGIAEMAGLGTSVRERCEALDAVGNTTAALGKGFSVASAGLAALAWIATYFEVTGIPGADLRNVGVIAGVMVGGVLPFVFSALAIKGVSLGSFDVVAEVRRQFKEMPGIMDGTTKPDYVTCVDIATQRALKAMLVPGIIVIVVPLLLGFTLGPEAVTGLLVGSLVSGFLLAVMMANSGGAWDNAKKYIEAGEFGGKGSEAHKAAVIGDTVGDPFKDTAGPSLNILIKLVGKIAVIFGPVFVALIVF